MAKSVSCRDLGMDCDFVARGETNEEVMTQIREHGRRVHGMKDADFTPELTSRIRDNIRDDTARRA